MKYWLSFIFFSSFYLSVFATQNHCLNDTSQYIAFSNRLIIKDIVLVGNKQTVDRIIIRELDFFKNDTIDVKELPTLIERNQNKIFNTNLFIEVNLLFIPSNEEFYTVYIHLKERWYIFPVPILELADRNFNEWWQEQDRDYHRLEYGLKFIHQNFRGRKEQLKLVLQTGFTKKYELFYTVPYINKKQTIGMGFSLSYSQNAQVAFQTNEHKLDYYKGDGKILRERFYAGISINRRNKFYGNHELELKYHQNSIHDSIALLNPTYFLDAKTKQKYFRIFYAFSYDRRNITVYPLKGYFIRGEIEKMGLGVFDDVNIFATYAKVAKYYEYKHKIYSAHSLISKLSFPAEQPYFNAQGLGYKQDFVRGYELDVINGQHYFLSRNEIKKHLFSYKHNLENILKVSQLNVVPYSWYFKIHTDIGYVVSTIENPLNNRLTNRILVGYGVGIDLFSFYDTVWRFEYSFNNVQKHGFFFGISAGI